MSVVEPSRWLCCDGRAVAPVTVARTRAERRRGLLGREGIDGALLIERTSSVHTFGMRFAIDVALLDAAGQVVATLTLPPGRLTRPRRQVRSVVEAEAGSLERWGITSGVVLTLRTD